MSNKDYPGTHGKSEDTVTLNVDYGLSWGNEEVHYILEVPDYFGQKVELGHFDQFKIWLRNRGKDIRDMDLYEIGMLMDEFYELYELEDKD